MNTSHHISPYAYVGMVDCNIRTGKAVIKIAQPHEKCMKIAKAVCEFYCMDLDTITSNSRKRNIVEPRQLAMYLMCEDKVSLTAIGKFFNKDHTTVITSRDVVKSLLSVDSDYRKNLIQIRVFMNELKEREYKV